VGAAQVVDVKVVVTGGRDFIDDLVVAFPGGRGTQSTVEQARRLGLEVIEVHHDRS
jgi:hypothetical protein